MTEKQRLRKNELQREYYKRHKKDGVKSYIKKGHKHYIDRIELKNEAMKSIELGYRTKRLDELFILLSERTFRTIKYRYKDSDQQYDCYMFGLMSLFDNWRNFNPMRGCAFNYYTEIVKRGFCYGYVYVVKQIKYNNYKNYDYINVFRYEFDKFN